jgi:hypothetical protein
VLAVKLPRKRGARPRRGGAHASAGPRRRPAPRATTVRFSLTEPASVTLALDRGRRGRKPVSGGRCRVRARKGRHCIRWTRAREIRHAGAAGENAIRVRSRGLRPGLYRMTLSAVDGVGNVSAPRLAPLRIVPLPRR